MIEPIIFNVTYQTTTPESVELGDFEDQGFEVENLTFDDFYDLVSYIESNGFHNWSCSPYTAPSQYVWCSTDFEIDDYRTMEETSLSIHPQNLRSARYLMKAVKLAR